MLTKLRELFAPVDSDEEDKKRSVPPARPKSRLASPAPSGEVVAAISLALERFLREKAGPRPGGGVARTRRREGGATGNDGWVVSGRIEQVNRDPRY